MRPHLVSWLDGVMPHWLAALLAPTWFTCVGLAGVLGVCWMIYNARRAQLDPMRVGSVVLWSYLAAVIAGIAVPMALESAEQLVVHQRFAVRWAGMTSFWGYLAAFAVAAWLTRRHRLELPRFADVIAAPLGAALVLCRLGCFLGGCDFGKVSSAPWALRFPMRSPAWHDHVQAGLLPPGRTASLPVHPTQLYEALLGLVMIAVAMAVARSAWGRARSGRAFLAVAGVYGAGRIGVEMLRGDAGRGLWIGLSSGQLFSLALLGAVAIAMLMQRRGPAVLGRVAAVALALLLIGKSEWAAAWPAPSTQAPTATPAPATPGTTPVPAQSPTPSPAQAPTTAQPISPYEQQPQPISPYEQQPPPVMAPAPAPQQAGGRPRYELGAMMGLATPLNRPSGQVGTLAGPSLSAGMVLTGDLMLWLDFDSLGNDDASHGSLTLSAGAMRTLSGGKLELGARLGVGFTLVNFDEPAFRDVTGSNVRAEALINYPLGERWQLWARPLSFDLLQNSQLGGPIFTWQIRLGVAARFGSGYPSAKRPASPMGPPPMAPPGAMQPPVASAGAL